MVHSQTFAPITGEEVQRCHYVIQPPSQSSSSPSPSSSNESPISSPDSNGSNGNGSERIFLSMTIHNPARMLAKECVIVVKINTPDDLQQQQEEEGKEVVNQNEEDEEEERKQES